MKGILALLAILSVVQEMPDSARRDTLSEAPANEPARSRLLSADEFVSHLVAIRRLEDKYGDDWELFRKKRDEYLSSNGLTPDQFTAFLDDRQMRPEYWTTLWEAIQKGVVDTTLASPDTKDSPGAKD